jgi:hypothetical protein
MKYIKEIQIVKTHYQFVIQEGCIVAIAQDLKV